MKFCKAFSLYYSLLIVLSMQLVFAQTRKDLLWEYNKMILNDGYLNIAFANDVKEHTNREIKDILNKAWVKKQIIILLQLSGYLDLYHCYYADYDELAAVDSLKNIFEEQKLTVENDPFNQKTLELLSQIYLNDPPSGSLPLILKEKNIGYDDADNIIVIFKDELLLQLFARQAHTVQEYGLISEYKIRNDRVRYLGPKSRKGDGLTPEGIYDLVFYPALRWSDFYLAFRVTYPNDADKIRKEYWGIQGKIGGDINIHGYCVSIGCVPLGNPAICELFFFLRQNMVKNNRIKVMIFPFQFDLEINQSYLEAYYQRNKKVAEFWESLNPIYTYFIENKKIPNYQIDQERGYYQLLK